MQQKLPTWVEVDLDNLLFNIAAIRRHIREGAKILLTVKADAYGHGAVQVATAVSEFVDMFGVATIDEAIELKQSGIDERRVLILSPILEKEIPRVVEEGFAVTVSYYAFGSILSQQARAKGGPVEIHIEVDTGMGRTGVFLEDAEREILQIAMLPGVSIGGIYTHFPVSDTDAGFTRSQIVSFLSLIAALAARGVSIPLVHSANSSALDLLAESHMDMVRPGLLAYGHLAHGSAGAVQAKPVMSWKSRLVQVRRIPAGKSISYGNTFTTSRDTVMGVVPVGYGHGLPFKLSNKGEMLVGGRRVPIIGRVTMDMTMIDLTDLPQEPVPGDEVVFFGSQNGGSISLHELAEWAQTIPYEILCGISKRVPRTYLRKGKVEAYKSLLGVIANYI
ncbi:MAG: alanine racemase [Chitinivibrionia bacterium]|nr:alanine racemase [Chitinivibrionia bacterium]